MASSWWWQSVEGRWRRRSLLGPVQLRPILFFFSGQSYLDQSCLGLFSQTQSNLGQADFGQANFGQVGRDPTTTHNNTKKKGYGQKWTGQSRPLPSKPPFEAERTDFGQSRFGHPDLTNFGQSNFYPFLAILVFARPILANPILANPILASVCVMVGPKRWGPQIRLRTEGAQTQEKSGLMGGRPEGWRPKGWAQNFAFFLTFSRHHRSFCISMGGI